MGLLTLRSGISSYVSMQPSLPIFNGYGAKPHHPPLRRPRHGSVSGRLQEPAVRLANSHLYKDPPSFEAGKSIKAGGASAEAQSG